MRGNKTRFAVVSLLVMSSVLGGIALTDTASAQSVSIEEITTTRGEELTSDVWAGEIAKSQDIKITVGYQGIPASPSSPQTIELVDVDIGGVEDLASTTITDSNGEVNITVPYQNMEDGVTGFLDPDSGLELPIDVEARWVNNGEVLETSGGRDIVVDDVGTSLGNLLDDAGITDYDGILTTIYIDSDTLPDSANEGEDVTVDFYGWSSEDEIFPELTTADESNIKPPSQAAPGTDNFFTGSITFTPSDEVNSGGSIDIQMHTEGENGPKSNVESIDVLSGPEANINSVSQPSGTYTTGEDVSATVTVTNTGQQGNTFFVGYSVVAPNGDIFDNQNTTGKTVTLASGEQKTVTVDWTVQNAAPSGQYDTIVSVWRESDRTNLQTRLDKVRKQNAFTVGSPPNQPPTASFTFSPNDPDVGETINFDASGSNDPDGTIQSYSWDFGDNNDDDGGSVSPPPVPGSSSLSTSTGEQTTHSYSSSGTYTVELTVTDDDGDTDMTSQSVSVGSSASVDDIQTSLSDTDGDDVPDRVEVDVNVSDAARTVIELGESNFEVDASPTDDTQGSLFNDLDPDGDGTPEGVQIDEIGGASTTYTVIADLSGQSDGDTGTVDVNIDEGADTASETYTVGEGPLNPNNPFGDANGDPVGVGDAANVLFQWNQNNGVVDGVNIPLSDMADFLFEWNQARN